ncbi:MAG TPA: dihydroneopterin aldolase [Candidatus Omnitrophota bacterium]|nr:dihydroneopterin aldolase [Candidatus Omnitrophota bacterium]HRY85822.1 dihydroneopterin aldolase [Candidatus Omnitrophota bacterium]
MADKIFIEKLEIRCIIGTLPKERKKKQKIVIDMEFPAPVSKPAKRDDLRDALNYKKIADHTVKFVSRSCFHLIETLAERLSRQLLKEFELKRILLRISKPGAIRNAKNVGVEIQRP